MHSRVGPASRAHFRYGTAEYSSHKCRMSRGAGSVLACVFVCVCLSVYSAIGRSMLRACVFALRRGDVCNRAAGVRDARARSHHRPTGRKHFWKIGSFVHFQRYNIHIHAAAVRLCRVQHADNEPRPFVQQNVQFITPNVSLGIARQCLCLRLIYSVFCTTVRNVRHSTRTTFRGGHIYKLSLSCTFTQSD